MSNAGRIANEDSTPLQALSIALKHPVISSRPCNVCSLAQVCRACRQAVQQAAGGSTSIIKRAPSLDTIVSFASWFPKHAGLVSSITVELITDPCLPGEISGVPLTTYINTARQLLQQSLQLARPAMTKLRFFSSNYLQTPGILSSLSESLTQLSVDYKFTDNFNGPGVLAALARMRGLQQLKLHTGCKQLPGTCLAGLGQLTRLTQLDMRVSIAKGDAPLLEQVLQAMPALQQLQLLLHFEGGRLFISDEDELVMNLTPMPALVDLALEYTDYVGYPGQGSTLPAQLQRLQLGYASNADLASLLNITTLTQLQQLTVLVNHSDSVGLESLARLSQLQQLALRYEAPYSAADTAAAWSHLPQLCSLTVSYEDEPATSNQIYTILSGLAGTSNLTKLYFLVWSIDVDDEEGEILDVDVFKQLSRLSKLKDLTVFCATKVKKKSAMALAALTGLTSLNLNYAGNAVGDAVATALGCNLTGLQSLELRDCQLGDCACLAPMARLTGLNLSNNSGLKGLRKLPGLTNLKALNFSSNSLKKKDLMSLTGLTNLRALNLSSNSLKKKDLMRLTGLTNLRALNLSSNSLREKDLMRLTGLTNLTALDLGGNKGLTEGGLMSLTGLTNLQRLSVGWLPAGAVEKFWAAVRW